jgi:hypothetical protein
MSFAAQKLPLPSLELIVPAYELPEVLPDDIVALKALIFAQQAAYAATIGTVTRAAHASIQRIIEQVVLARHRQFGASSEQMPSQARLFDEAEALAHDTEDKQDIAPVPQERVPEQDSDKQSKKSARGKRHPCLLIVSVIPEPSGRQRSETPK